MDRLLFLLICLSPLGIAAEVWPEFRGPGGDGISHAENLPAEFSEDSHLVWKTDLPGRGWSSPVFDGEFLWVTTAEEIFPTEEERVAKLKADGESERKFKSRQVARKIDLALLKIDFESGDIVQAIPLRSIENPQTIHTLNSFASPTPVLSGDRVFAHFGTFGTFAIDRSSGDRLWKTEIPLEHGVGPGSSPIVTQDLLVLICDGIDRQFVTALSTEDGKEVWTTERPEMRAKLGDQKKSYNTPVVFTSRDGREQLVCMGAQWLISYDPATGKEWWRYDHGSGFSVVPRPVFSEKHQLIFVSTGFGKPRLIAVRVDGAGDITNADRLAWEETKRIPAKPSPLLVGDELYVISDGGVATCFDAGSGVVHWTERVSGNYSASPLLADGKIFFANQEGTVTVMEPGRSYLPLASNTLPGSIMASPIAWGESLLIRTEQSLYRFAR